mmetsp:Transcript_11050/g.24193  ORF Transcript_11050/g.24193 Transcript_11050/m.24193 type:complete len:353 (-) Transcript_11050:814-1872(-)
MPGPNCHFRSSVRGLPVRHPRGAGTARVPAGVGGRHGAPEALGVEHDVAPLPVDQGVLNVHGDGVRPRLENQVTHPSLHGLIKRQHHRQQVSHVRPVPRHALLRRQHRRRHVRHAGARQGRPRVEGVRAVVPAASAGVGVEDDAAVRRAEQAGALDLDWRGGPGEGGEALVKEDAAGSDAVLGDAEDLQVLGLGVGALRVPRGDLHPLFRRPLPKADHIQPNVSLVHPMLQRQVQRPLHRVRRHVLPASWGDLGIVLVHTAAKIVADDLRLPVGRVGVGRERRAAHSEGDGGFGLELAEDRGGVRGVGRRDHPLESRSVQCDATPQLHPVLRLETVPAIAVADLINLVLRRS